MYMSEANRKVLLKTPAVKCELTRMSCAMRVVHSSMASKSTRYTRFSPSLLIRDTRANAFRFHLTVRQIRYINIEQ